MIESGKTLQQRYRIDKQIGQGGMGAVYVATDERFQSTVAIKETLCMDDSFRKALEREARLLNSLKHAALPRVSDHFIEENGQFLVMEYIPGDDLAVILEKTGKPFPFEKVLKWADQLLDALEFLHGQSMPVIHRDIKPQNLKLTTRDQIILLDFGLAKGNPTDAGVHTAAKSIFGYSRNYASLEQIQGTGTDPRSDLYSLAATLYHLATGHAPEDALTRAMAVLSNQPDPLIQANILNREIPAGFAGVLRSALDLNAAFRPASAAEMRHMLGNMDSYAQLAGSGAAATAPGVDITSQKTMLMPGATHLGPGRIAGAKTDVLPVYVSEETAVRPSRPAGPLNSGQTVSGRNPVLRIAAIAASLLLLIGGIAAGTYVLFSADGAGDAQNGLPATEQPAAAANIATQAEPASEQPAETASAAAEQPAKAETDKNPSKPSPKGDKRTIADQRTKIEITGPEDDPTVYIGNMKVKDGRVETPDTIIDENGVMPRAPKVPPPTGFEPGRYPDPSRLTPAQRRRLQELRRKGLIPPVRRPGGRKN